MRKIEIYYHAIERARHFRALAARQESKHSRYYIGKVAESWDDVAARTLDEMIEAVSYVGRHGLDVGSDGTVSVRDAHRAES